MNSGRYKEWLGKSVVINSKDGLRKFVNLFIKDSNCCIALYKKTKILIALEWGGDNGNAIFYYTCGPLDEIDVIGNDGFGFKAEESTKEYEALIDSIYKTVAKEERKSDMVDYSFYEIDFGNKNDEGFNTGNYEAPHTIAIKADHYPDCKEVERFCAKDMKDLGCDSVWGITELTREEVYSYFATDNIDEWPVLRMRDTDVLAELTEYMKEGSINDSYIHFMRYGHLLNREQLYVLCKELLLSIKVDSITPDEYRAVLENIAVEIDEQMDDGYGNESKETKKINVKKAVNNLKDAWLKCSEALTECDDYLDIIIDDYPFEDAFDDYTFGMIDWANNVEKQVEKELAKPKVVYETNYSDSYDRTFIMKCTYKGEDMLSEECVGFYSGEPNEKDTETFKGSLIATYSM